jgi:hypothetical protein
MHEHLKSKYIYAFVLQHSDPIALSMSERCFNREKTTGINSRAGTAYPSAAPRF